MLKPLKISNSAIIERLKISCQFPIAAKEVLRHQIIKDTAEAEGVELSDAELQQAADDFRVEHSLYDTDETWRWLQNNCLTGDEFEQLIYESKLTSKLIQHLFGDRIEAYFYEHQLDYTQAVIYEAVLPDFDTAIELYYALKERETTFMEVARKYISEPNLRRLHGYKGVLTRQELDSAISPKVFAAKAPEILKPIVVDRQAHLILVEEIIEPQLTDAVREQILAKLFMEWLEQQSRLYAIEIPALSEPSTT